MFRYEWEHEGQVYRVEQSTDIFGTPAIRYGDVKGTFSTTLPDALALEFKHLVEENKRLQEANNG